MTNDHDSAEGVTEETWLAHERMLMSWISISTSMITFGFTIYKFFEFEEGREAVVNSARMTPRIFALILMSIGLVSLAAAAIQNRRRTRGHARPRVSLAEIVAGFMSLFGVLMVLTALF